MYLLSSIFTLGFLLTFSSVISLFLTCSFITFGITLPINCHFHLSSSCSVCFNWKISHIFHLLQNSFSCGYLKHFVRSCLGSFGFCPYLYEEHRLYLLIDLHFIISRLHLISSHLHRTNLQNILNLIITHGSYLASMLRYFLQYFALNAIFLHFVCDLVDFCLPE